MPWPWPRRRSPSQAQAQLSAVGSKMEIGCARTGSVAERCKVGNETERRIVESAVVENVVVVKGIVGKSIVLDQGAGQRLESRDSGGMVRKVVPVPVLVRDYNLCNNLMDRKVRMILRALVDASTAVVVRWEERIVMVVGEEVLVTNMDLREDSGGTKSLVERVFVETE